MKLQDLVKSLSILAEHNPDARVLLDEDGDLSVILGPRFHVPAADEEILAEYGWHRHEVLAVSYWLSGDRHLREAPID